MTPARLAVAAVAVAAILLSAWRLGQAEAGLAVEEIAVGAAPVTVMARESAPPGPAVVVAHGLAGSRQLMEPFAVTLARAGYTVLNFDFPGHGAHPEPWEGSDIPERLADLDETLAAVVAEGRARGDGRVALLGHSMASDLVVRHAVADPEIAATIAVSLYTEAATPTAPRNLLIVNGAWEGRLNEAGLEIVARTTGAASEAVRPERTYGSLAEGTGRRLVLADSTEHVGVLYSPESLVEAASWLDAVFGRESAFRPDVRGPWVLLLVAGIVALGWPLAALLPRLTEPAAGAGLGWGGLLAIAVVPAVATPLLLWPVPTGWLPVLLADYLTLHFALYGLLIAAGLRLAGRLPIRVERGGAVLAVAAAVALYSVGAMVAALDAHVASYWPTANRALLMLALLAGILPYMLADGWLVARPAAPRGAGAMTKVLFLASLGIAVALRPGDLFFLVIILPVVLLFFLLYGLFGAWVSRATGQPAVAALANAAAFAWALGVTFPILGR